MLVKVDEAPFIRDFLAGFFTWLLLAGYVVFPGAFTSLRDANALDKIGNVGDTFLTEFQKSILSLVVVYCIVAALGIGWLWWKCCANYIWLEYHLFLQVFLLRYLKLDQLTSPRRPGLRYSVAGLISKILNGFKVKGTPQIRIWYRAISVRLLDISLTFQV
jgi:hypothetical protein